MIEEWRPVSEFPERYEVSNFGNLRSKDRVQENSSGPIQHYKSFPIKANIHRGYYRVRLCIDRKKFSRNIHRLVADTWIPNPDGKKEVNHIDGNKLNNCVTNLEWVTKQENMDHAVIQGLIDNPFGEKARNFKGTTRAWKDGICHYEMNGNKEILEAGFCYKLVSACIIGKQKTHRGYTFTRG